MGSKPNMTTTMTNITPHMASEWLSKNNNGNRRIRSSLVSLMARQMADGRWRPTHQGIAFYSDSTLADGQHRLHAIVESGVSCWMPVTTGVDRESMHAMDRGAGRTHMDSLHFIGREISQKQIAICQCLVYQYEAERLGREGWSPAKIPSELFSLFYDRFSGAIEFTMGFGGVVKYPAPFQASVASAWFVEDRSRLAEYMTIIETGRVSSDSDMAAVRIRDYLADRQYGFGTTARHDMFLRCCSGLRYFLDGRNLKRLYATPDHAFKFATIIGEVG